MDFPFVQVQRLIDLIREGIASGSLFTFMWENAGEVLEACMTIIQWVLSLNDNQRVAAGNDSEILAKQRELADLLTENVPSAAMMAADLPKGLPWFTIISLIVQILLGGGKADD